MEEAIPEFLYEKLLKQYGENLTLKIIDGYSKVRPVTFRVNTLKATMEEITRKLEEAGIDFENVKWYEDAIIIKKADEQKIRNLEIYDEGKIYMQSLSSMLPAIVLEPKADENILDMAAAPGGKTTQITAMSNNKAFITACEKNKIRAERLKYNLEKQGASRVNVLIQDARNLNNLLSFDKVLLDAPCSGSGTIDIKNSKLKQIFTTDLVERSKKLQYELLNKALNILKVGNEMVYSTCSILKEENEKHLEKLLEKNRIEVVPIEQAKLEGLPFLPVEIPGTICICPNELYEGFFIAKIKRIS